MDMGFASALITSESQITADLLTETSIQFDNIAENLVSDATNTRDIGTGSVYWRKLYVNELYCGSLRKTIVPSADDTYNLGNISQRMRTIWTNKIEGDAVGQMMVFSLLFGG